MSGRSALSAFAFDTTWTNACAWPLDHWAIVLTGVADSSLRSFAVGAVAGGDFVPAHGQEPAARRMAVRNGRRVGGRLLFRLAVLSVAGGIDRVGDARGLRALGVGCGSPAIQARGLSALESASARLRVSCVSFVDRAGTDCYLAESRSQFRAGDVLGCPIVVSPVPGGPGVLDAQGVSATRMPPPQPDVLDLECRRGDRPDRSALFVS